MTNKMSVKGRVARVHLMFLTYFKINSLFLRDSRGNVVSNDVI
jgi:hypothetical protein